MRHTFRLMRIDLNSPTDVLGFRAQANAMLANQVPPAEIAWAAHQPLSCGVPLALLGPHATALPSALHAIVPRSFVRLTELVVLHREPARFELLYRLLWRLVHEPELAGSAGDVDMALAHSMAQAVRRDILRTRRALHLRVLAGDDGPLALGWCEPQHFVTEQVADALTGLVPQGPWLLASPDRTVLWTSGGQLLCGPGVAAGIGHAASDAYWHDLAAQLSTGMVETIS